MSRTPGGCDRAWLWPCGGSGPGVALQQGKALVPKTLAVFWERMEALFLGEKGSVPLRTWERMGALLWRCALRNAALLSRFKSCENVVRELRFKSCEKHGGSDENIVNTMQ